ncbi:cache domain-containing protein [Polyangium sp. 6x1]|uniref:cache domain-containing protein n=1 Tax=Polyangium sp. 6x1 TaxID=3042689 RepID=UPI002482648E|nr:cache domain-containing protein [Polyangium sp. 6x1]MDI1450203.1 cache domain-containing protein [Polyangium sp. 6x1]
MTTPTLPDEHADPPAAVSGAADARPRTTLARQTLLRMALRLSLVIAALTAVSYWHTFGVATQHSLDGLANHIAARARSERWLFDLAIDNLRTLAAEVPKRLREAPPGDPKEAFDRRFVAFPDGVVRSRLEGFDPARHAGATIMNPAELDAAVMRRVLVYQDAVAQMGLAMHTRFQNTYIVDGANFAVTYWPASPRWTLEIKPNHDYAGAELFVEAAPAKNPERKSSFSQVYIDPVLRAPVVTMNLPMYDGERFLGIVGHDITLTELLDRTVNVRLDGTYNLIVHRNGNIIAHPALTRALAEANGGLHVSKSGDPALPAIHAAALAVSFGEGVTEAGDAHLGVAHIDGPDWFFVTVYPKSRLRAQAFQSARFVLFGGLASLLLEVLLLSWVLKKEVAAPLGALTQATRKVSAGEMDVALDRARRDELGELAEAFHHMTDAVREREAQSKESREALQKLAGELEAMLLREREKNDALSRLRAAVDVLSTPVLEVWKDVLALPIVGAVDEQRAQKMMEKVLDEVARTQCRYMILDITGVDTIDAATADRLLKVAAAVEMLGARCVLTGIRPVVARALLSLDVSFGDLRTLRTLEDGLRHCLHHLSAAPRQRR